MKLLDSSAILKPGFIKTKSRLQKWWLTVFGGYAVERVIHHPKKYTMGKLIYENTWILKPVYRRSAE